MSIVIVTIGLIVAGVVGGQKLVEQAKLRSQIADFRKYEVAYNSFVLEYSAVPGDFNRANLYWSGSPIGNGDGRLSTGADSCYSENECKRFWRHLSDAKLIPESYPGSGTIKPGVTNPALKINPKYGMTAAGSIASGTGNESGPVYQLTTAVGTKRYTAALFLNDSRYNNRTDNWFDDMWGTASPQVYSTIDNKIDDGSARDGIFRAYRARGSVYGNCMTATDGEDYLLSNERNACHAFYILEK